MSGSRDRRQTLLSRSPATLNGIDYAVIVNAARTEIDVHFLTALELRNTATSARITGGQTTPVVPVTSMVWRNGPTGTPVLTLMVAAPGDASAYTLSLYNDLLDPFFSQVPFWFTAGEVSTLDCKPVRPVAPVPPADVPPIDYLAKDFLSFREALSDFSKLRYPAWQERSEADFGVMFMEALCGLGDDLSYQQDRIAAEAWLATATERLSIVRHARLADYEPAPALAASVTLQFSVNPKTTGIPAGLAVSAPGPDGTAIYFETGTGLADTTLYPANAAWNAIVPYWWDESTRILPAGATEIWVNGQSLSLSSGNSLLLDTAAAEVGLPNIREAILVGSVNELTDPLYQVPLTHIVFQAALIQAHDLTVTTVKGNLVPATQGLRHIETFAIGTRYGGAAQAIARTGPNQTVLYLYPLGNAPLTWLATAGAPATTWAPEIVLTQQLAANGAPTPWTWYRSLLDAPEFAAAFTIDPVRFTQLPPELANGAAQFEYDGDAADTIRFGDGDFGEVPDANSFFTVLYRAGGGNAGNVAADSITAIAHTGPFEQLASAVNNPFPATGGTDEETDASVRLLAPYSFQSAKRNAVLAADYAAAAMTLPWVARAGGTVRHTGSWLTAFTAVEAAVTKLVTEDQLSALTSLLNRYKLAGNEAYALPPDFVSLDLRIAASANPGAFNADVAGAILQALGTGTLPDGSSGFFAHGNFTFGQPLERSALEAAIQKAQGVAGIHSITYRRHGSAVNLELTDQIKVGVDQIIRVDNNPGQPANGSIAVTVSGGK